MYVLEHGVETSGTPADFTTSAVQTRDLIMLVVTFMALQSHCFVVTVVFISMYHRTGLSTASVTIRCKRVIGHRVSRFCKYKHLCGAFAVVCVVDALVQIQELS